MKWIGRTIISQYGMVCEVLEDNGDMVKCRNVRNERLWDLPINKISLVTKDGEILDVESGEIYGSMVGDNWDLYAENQCRLISPQEVENS